MGDKNTAEAALEPEELEQEINEAVDQMVEESAAGEQDADEEPEEIEVDDSEEEAEEGEQKPKKKQSAQKRINQLTWQKREEERIRKQVEQDKDLADKAAEYWRRVAMGEAPEVPAEHEQQSRKDGRPSLEQYDTQEEYQDAYYKWRKGQEAAMEYEARRKAEEQMLHQRFFERAEKVKKDHPDFDQVINSANVFTPEMRKVIWRSELGPEIGYFLSRPENQRLAMAIATMPADAQGYELGKIETRFAEQMKRNKPTSAPAPIKPVGKPSAQKKSRSEMTTAEFMAEEKRKRLERVEKKLGRR